MTTIYCSNKLQKWLGRLDSRQASEGSNFQLAEWNGHLFYVHRKKCLAITNNQTFYTVFLPDVVKKDLKGFQALFYERLTQQLYYDAIITSKDQSFIEDQLGPLTLAKTNSDRRTIGVMNDFIVTFKHYCFSDYPHLSDVNTLYLNSLINDTPTLASTRNATFPKDALKALLKDQAD
jgi:hypothetical protein